MTTNVIFRKWPNGDVIAMFPDEPADHLGYFCNSYMHVGQHSSASPEIVNDTVPASPDEYADLLRELRIIGYSDLRIVKRFSRGSLDRRRAALVR